MIEADRKEGMAKKSSAKKVRFRHLSLRRRCMQLWDTRWSKDGVDTVKVKAHFDVRAYLNIKQDVIIQYFDFYGKRQRK